MKKDTLQQCWYPPFPPPLPSQDAMARLASAVPEAELGKACYPLYEHFRPAWKGWGQSAELDIDGICQLAQGGAWKEFAP